MSQALYRKWRPRLWDEVVGQDHIVSTIRNAIATDRVGHAYIFSGPRGTGKTTTARLLAKAVNCTAEAGDKPCDQCPNCLSVNDGSFIDLIEIDAATNTGVDDVRDLKDRVNFAPNIGKYKIYIIDEVHMFTNNAFNALLKTLEEPPAHAIFILATTDLHKVPPTILSRCQRFEFRRIPVATVVSLLRKNADQEGIDVPDDVLMLIARQSTGSMRDAISLLDQLSSVGRQVTMEEAVNLLGTASNTAITDIMAAIISGDAARGLDLLQAALDSGAEARQLARQMVDHLHNLLLAKNAGTRLVDATREAREVFASQAKQLSTRQILVAMQRFQPLVMDTRKSSWHPGIDFELALVETIEDIHQPAVAVATDKPAPEIVQPVKTPPQIRTETPEKATASKPHPVVAPSRQQQTQSITETPRQEPAIPPANPSEPDIQAVSASWRKIAEAVRKYSPGTSGLINSCKPAYIKDGKLFLGFASETLKEKMEKDDHQEFTRRAIKHVTGQDLAIRCIVSSSDMQGADANRHETGEADGMLSTALREMGGRVVDVKDVKEE